jgi:hypothetical protein
MENRDRTDAQGERAGGTPYHEDEPIKGGRQGQGGEQGGQSGRPDQGDDEDVGDEDSTGGSNVNSESGQRVRPQDPATRLSPSDDTSTTE